MYFNVVFYILFLFGSKLLCFLVGLFLLLNFLLVNLIVIVARILGSNLLESFQEVVKVFVAGLNGANLA